MKSLPLKRVIGLITAISAFVYSVFIWRASTVLDGQRTFVLFDDAMISMRYAQNLSNGHGLVFNIGGPPVEGFTNLGWVLWMSLLHLLPIPARFMALPVSITSGVFLIATIWLAARLTNLLVPKSRYAPVAAAGLTASCYSLAYWSLHGMEVGVIAFLVTAAAVTFTEWHHSGQRRYLIRIALLISLGLLVRPDAAIVAAITIVFVGLTSTKQNRIKSIVAVASPIVLLAISLTAFRSVYFEAVVPNTYLLKVSKIPLESRLERGGLSMLTELLRTGLGIMGAAALIGWTKFGRSWPFAYCATIVIAVCAYSVYVGGDAWETYRFPNRYISIALPLLFALVAASYSILLEGHPVDRRLVVWLASALSILLAFAFLPLPKLDDLDVSTITEPVFVAGLLLIALALAIGLANSRYPLSVTVAVIIVGTCIASSGMSYNRWFRHNAEDVDTQRHRAAYGLILQRDTEPGATIAVSAAGNAPYFAPNRAFVDELGKMDPAIAAMSPRRLSYPPGHQKWNYEHSVKALRPDLLAEVFALTPQDVEEFSQWGYTQLLPGVFVRNDTTKVDVEALKRDYLRLPPES